jgi:hypothetical protein
MLPIIVDYTFTGSNGSCYLVEIEIFATENLSIFSEGVSATFRLFSMDEFMQKILVYLVDNHFPHGFHEHDQLPQNHQSRRTLHVRNWQEAWTIFQDKCRSISK